MRRWTLATALTLTVVGIAPVGAGHHSGAVDCHGTSLRQGASAPLCAELGAEPTCAAPCYVAPADCAPACAVPVPVAADAPVCVPEYQSPHCDTPRKKSFLARLWELEKRKNACIVDTFFDWVD